MKRMLVASLLLISACDTAINASPTPNVTIKVGPPEIQYGGAQSFPLEVTNQSGSDIGFLQIECQLRRSDGSLIQAGNVFVDNLLAGSTKVEPAIWMTTERGVLSCSPASTF